MEKERLSNIERQMERFMSKKIMKCLEEDEIRKCQETHEVMKKGDPKLINIKVS